VEALRVKVGAGEDQFVQLKTKQMGKHDKDRPLANVDAVWVGPGRGSSSCPFGLEISMTDKPDLDKNMIAFFVKYFSKADFEAGAKLATQMGKLTKECSSPAKKLVAICDSFGVAKTGKERLRSLQVVAMVLAGAKMNRSGGGGGTPNSATAAGGGEGVPVPPGAGDKL
jgi:hypothetical protein